MHKNQIKKGGFIFLLALLLTISPLLSPAVQAASLKKPFYAYGESLTEAQKKETAQLLGVKEGADETVVQIREMNGLLHDSYHYYQVYSSVYLIPDDSVDGVKVEIVTPKTITAIKPVQYENAAITAGAVNMKVKVASVKAVDGSGALAGVYKAFQAASGQALPEENVKAAQKELTVTQKINEENEGKDGYSNELLNAAIADMKRQIADAKEKAGGDTTNINIGQIVNNVINNYQLGGILTEENKKQLEDLMKEFSKVELTEDQKKALQEFGEKLVQEGGKLMDSAKKAWDDMTPESKEEVGNFFSRLFQAIADFFKRLFSQN